jgi:hypothetical protein
METAKVVLQCDVFIAQSYDRVSVAMITTASVIAGVIDAKGS